MRIKYGICAVAAMAGMYACSMPAMAQASLISGAINESNLVTLTHNTRPEAIKANDRGVVAGDKQLSGMELVLRRSPDSEKAFNKALNDLYNPKSASFHHWMTNAEIGKRFGLGDGDIGKINAWLGGHGLHVSGVSPDRTFITFSGTVGQLNATFHTSIHNLSVNGVHHFANMSDPVIPAALASAVTGVMQLHDFYPHPMMTPRFMPKHGKKPDYSLAAGCFPANPTTHTGSFTNECEFVTPADLATIYDMKPLFNAGITGLGQTVVVVEDTNVYKMADWNIFRAVMGLSGYTHGSFTLTHPTGTTTCTDPGVVAGADGEAILDADYASASAPNAAIVMASCKDGAAVQTFGGLVAIQNIEQQTNHASIISMSYGECEASDGATGNAAFNNAAKTGAAEGISIYVSSGDESSTSCDANQSWAAHGLGVSGWMSSPYDISVGGTDYTDNSNASNPNLWKTYWNASNGTGYGSAKGYIPEQPWNDSCASEINSTFYTGSTLTYGKTGWCNTPAEVGGPDASNFATEFWSTGSGSGGPSGCATGAVASGTANRGIVSGTCAGWPKPNYQGATTSLTGTGTVIAPFAGEIADAVRDTPDVSLFAANGVWGHYYPYCDSDPNGAGTGVAGCTGADPANWAGAGGTSFSSPIFAGIQALINQKTGTTWGLTNTMYYQIAATQYGAGGNPTCNSSTGSGVGCAFHDVTAGDFNVDCGVNSRGQIVASPNCYKGSGASAGSIGVGSYSGNNSAPGYNTIPTSYIPMYKSATGWDFTTGIGTPDVANLVAAFPGGNQVSSVAKKH